MNCYYCQGDQEIGPFSANTLLELRNCGAVADETLVRNQDSQKWERYADWLASNYNQGTTCPPEILPAAANIPSTSPANFVDSLEKIIRDLVDWIVVVARSEKTKSAVQRVNKGAAEIGHKVSDMAKTAATSQTTQNALGNMKKGAAQLRGKIETTMKPPPILPPAAGGHKFDYAAENSSANESYPPPINAQPLPTATNEEKFPESQQTAVTLSQPVKNGRYGMPLLKIGGAVVASFVLLVIVLAFSSPIPEWLKGDWVFDPQATSNDSLGSSLSGRMAISMMNGQERRIGRDGIETYWNGEKTTYEVSEVLPEGDTCKIRLSDGRVLIHERTREGFRFSAAEGESFHFRRK